MTGRGRFQGVLQIWRFNRRFYLLTLGSVAVAGMVALWLPPFSGTILAGGAAAALVWIATSLAVSHYIYDRSPLYAGAWLREEMEREPCEIANFHAGLDEWSALLQARYPGARLRNFDIFDQREMTERSIARARELAGAAGTGMVDWRALPAETEAFDAILVFFAAHELRRREARAAFFEELARVLKPGGALLVMEHLRDLPNFLAFGPGFLHFFARREWLAIAHGAGLRKEGERPMTPFVRLFRFRR